jgi:FtsP/CotA-like multicopper oxidase with cupredoxin domain
VPPVRRPLLVTGLVVGGAALLVGLFFALRPDSETEPAVTPTTGETATTEQTTTTEEVTTAETSPPTSAAIATLRVRVRGGSPVGGIQRLTVQRGERVRVLVVSDVGDEVHLHGYDRSADVAPGAPAEIRLRATITGRFEIELEERGTPIAELQVR